MSSSSSPAAPSSTQTRRRRLRKGTFSCWECKRRKIRCILDPNTHSQSCNGCWRRGTQCVSQAFPQPEDVASPGGGRSRRDSIVSDRRTPPPGFDNIFTESAQFAGLDNYSENNNPARGKYERLSRLLHASLPSREDTERICTASRDYSFLPHEIMIMPYKALEQNGLATTAALLEFPEVNAHPVLIAKHMLLLAGLLRLLHPEQNREIKGLSETPRAIMERLVNLVVKLVTTNDDLLGSLEGLECIMIESTYQTNIGNLRRGWISCRRAMNIAQLMGLDQPGNQSQYKVLDRKTHYNTDHMWFRILYTDRYLSLMLGASQGCLDRSIASDAMLANDTPMGRLERLHCVIASQILERNSSRPSSDDIALTHSLDKELQKAARTMPHKWWLIPELETVLPDSQALFWNTRRLFVQVIHYNLLNQLHLPYMLHYLSAGRKYEYAQMSCVKASQEVLRRFIALGALKRVVCSCRTVDFLALMAAMTLLLAHLDSHRSEDQNLLAHSYHSDRAMIEQVQDNMKELNRLNSDPLSAQSAELLGRLLAIELETADSNPSHSVRVHEAATAEDSTDHGDEVIVSVKIPYFGIIKIARDGMSREAVKPPMATAATSHFPENPQYVDTNTESTPQVNVGYGHAVSPAMTSDMYSGAQSLPGMIPVPATHYTPQSLDDSVDPFLQYAEYPELAAEIGDWAFQGVDMAFFDSLMRSTGNVGDCGL